MKNHPTIPSDNHSQSDTHPDQNNKPSQQSEMQGNKKEKEYNMADIKTEINNNMEITRLFILIQQPKVHTFYPSTDFLPDTSSSRLGPISR